MPQVSQHPTFRRAPRTGRRADSSRAASSAAAARYRPAHRATSGASPRPYQPVGTRFNPPQITQPLPRVESPHREQLHEGGAPVSRGVRASAARPGGSRATRGRGAHISAAPRPHVRDARVEERHSRGGAAQVHRPHEARAAALHARVQREAARPEAANSAPRVPRSRGHDDAWFGRRRLLCMDHACGAHHDCLGCGGASVGSVAGGAKVQHAVAPACGPYPGQHIYLVCDACCCRCNVDGCVASAGISARFDCHGGGARGRRSAFCG